MNKVFKRFGLIINETKTKTMLLNFQETEENYPKTIAQLNNSEIENVKIFQYLGGKISFNQQNTGDDEITSRIDMAETAYHKHQKKFQNHKIKLATRVSILNSLVHSRLTYGCQTWILNNRQIDKLNSVYCKLLRKMIRRGFDRKPDEWAFIFSNNDILHICKMEDISTFVSKQKERYLAHMLRLPDNSMAKRLLFNSNASKLQGRQTNYLKSVLGDQDLREFITSARN